ncbi:hypothetical protein ACIQFZ_16970 [Streptomyces sp. NPDC093064]|uniref:hypothetical protein n=1 Tax=unclassified Streptomyces TaxID=2593676 RepID=UPI00341F65CA
MNSKTRTALVAGVLTVGLGLGTAVQASAGTPRSVSGKPSDNLTRVADFYGAYIDALIDEDSGHLGKALRSHYLTAGFQKKLNAWEAKNHANGVLRAQNVPLAWKVADNGSIGRNTEAVVTLTFSSGKKKLFVDVNRGHQVFRIDTKSLRK